jgi:hypothetical protein
MTESNPERGDVEIELGGQKFVMRPTFEAMVQMEQATGIGMLDLALRAGGGTLGISETTHIICAGITAATGNRATFDKFGPMVFKKGIMSTIKPVADLMANALSGGEKPGEDQAAEQTESLTDASPPMPTEA